MLFDEPGHVIGVRRAIDSSYLPLRTIGFFNQVRHKNAVAQIRQKINIAVRGWPDIQDAQAFLRFEPHNRLAPATGVARNSLA